MYGTYDVTDPVNVKLGMNMNAIDMETLELVNPCTLRNMFQDSISCSTNGFSVILHVVSAMILHVT